MITIDGGTGRGDRRARAARAAGGQRRLPHDRRAGPTSAAGSACARTPTRPRTPRKAREFGAEGIGLCRTEHMFMAEERLPVVREMILADDEDGREAALERAPADAAGRLRGHLPRHGRAAGDDPAARPAAARVPARPRRARGAARRTAAEGAERDAARARSAPACASCPSRTRCSARAAAGSAWCTPRSTRCRCGRSSRGALAAARDGERRAGRDHDPAGRLRARSSRGCARSSRRRWRRSSSAAGATLPYPIGTMIELPRAALRADRARRARPTSSRFGTNDLTQTALGLSRDDAEGRFLAVYLEDGVLERQPVPDDRPGRRRRARRARRRAGPRGASRTSSSASAASTAATRPRSRSSTGSGSTTSPARPSACRWRASQRPARRSSTTDAGRRD